MVHVLPFNLIKYKIAMYKYMKLGQIDKCLQIVLIVCELYND